MSSEICQQCGACCATFRVSFCRDESDETPGGTVPAAYTETINDHLLCMRGTDRQPARCIALSGTIGRQVTCRLYEWRPSPCRDFVPGSGACNDARRRWGMAPI